jgi:hypothetical protein
VGPFFAPVPTFSVCVPMLCLSLGCAGIAGAGAAARGGGGVVASGSMVALRPARVVRVSVASAEDASVEMSGGVCPSAPLQPAPPPPPLPCTHPMSARALSEVGVAPCVVYVCWRLCGLDGGPRACFVFALGVGVVLIRVWGTGQQQWSCGGCFRWHGTRDLPIPWCTVPTFA